MARGFPKLRCTRILSLVCVLTAPAVVAHAAAVSWTANSGDWSTASNWSTDTLPGSSDDVTIGSPGDIPSYTVTLNSGSQSINSLTNYHNLAITDGSLSVATASQIYGNFSLSNGALTGAGDVNLSGSFAWTGGTMSGSGTNTISAAGTAGITTPAVHYLNRGFRNNGAITWSGGPIDLHVSETLDNNGTFIADSASELDYYDGAQSVAGAFNNAGTFIKKGTGLARFYRYYTVFTSMPFNNSGTVDVKAGTLWLDDGGSQSGTFIVESGATLKFGGSHTLGATATISGDGDINVRDGILSDSAPMSIGGTATFVARETFNNTVTVGGLSVGNGTATFNGATNIGSGTLSGGTIAGAGNIILSGNFDWTYGTISTTGTITVPKNITLAMVDDNHYLVGTLRNDGNIRWSGKTISLSSFTINNNGKFNAEGGSFSGNGIFNNNGSFINNGITQFCPPDSYPVLINNSGTIDIQSGSLQIGYGYAGSTYTGGNNSGTITVEAGAALIISGNYS